MLCMKMARATESWLLSLRSQRKSERTQETYLLAVNQLSEFIDDPEITDITRHDVRRFLDHMLTTRSDSTARQRYGSLNAHSKECLPMKWAWIASPSLLPWASTNMR